MYYLFFKLTKNKLLCSHEKDNKEPGILIWKVTHILLNKKQQVITHYMYYGPIYMYTQKLYRLT